jgi:uncharacterized protein (TIGR04255 family)
VSGGASGKSHPDFENPPVIETVLGTEFRPLQRWQIPHFGLFWSWIRDEYPYVEEQPPLGGGLPTNEAGDFILQLAAPDVRCWYLEQQRARLLQVQRDRFIHNWRKRPESTEYPRYEPAIRPTFQREWIRFTDFLGAEKLGRPEVVRCEVTYINHFERGREWESPADLADVLSFLRRPESQFLPPFSPGKATLSFDMSREGGTLELDVVRAIRNSDAMEIFQLSLSAKGKPRSSEIKDMMSWFDLGRGWVVDAFVDVTTPRMHKLWKRLR